MTGAAQQRGGARLNLPRDIQTVYCIARMGAVTTQTIRNLFLGVRTRLVMGWLD